MIKKMMKVIDAQEQIIKEYEKKIDLLERENDLKAKVISDLIRVMKGADDAEDSMR